MGWQVVQEAAQLNNRAWYIDKALNPGKVSQHSLYLTTGRWPVVPCNARSTFLELGRASQRIEADHENICSGLMTDGAVMTREHGDYDRRGQSS